MLSIGAGKTFCSAREEGDGWDIGEGPFPNASDIEKGKTDLIFYL